LQSFIFIFLQHKTFNPEGFNINFIRVLYVMIVGLGCGLPITSVYYSQKKGIFFLSNFNFYF
jgi:hypothetical protein